MAETLLDNPDVTIEVLPRANHLFAGRDDRVAGGVRDAREDLRGRLSRHDLELARLIRSRRLKTVERRVVRMLGPIATRTFGLVTVRQVAPAGRM